MVTPSLRCRVVGDRASIGSFEWEAAFDEAGLDVEVPERSDAEVMVARGSVAQIVDDETGATAFVSLDEPRATDRGVGEAETERGAGAAAVNLGLRLGGARLLRVLGRKAGAAAARRWEAARRPEELRWMRQSDRGRDDEALMEVDDLREVMSRREMYRRLSRIGDLVHIVAERVWYAVVKEA